MTSFEEIGALLGFLAFAGLAVLVFLTFQQARHLRRLRDWAGRAPERAAAIAARQDPAAVGDEPSEAELAAARGPSRLGVLRANLRERWTEIDRRLPVDPRLLFGGLAAIVLGVGIATSGFGLVGGDSGSARPAKGADGSGSKKQGGGSGKKTTASEVAVLNGTAPPGGTGVPGIADRFSQNVRDAGFEVGAVDNAGSFTVSTVMWSGSGEADAKKLAEALSPTLGDVSVIEMTPEIEALAGGADVALVVGQDDATI
jgi:LytR cell envelope-related transcriptional attenuator